ncbi:hypothetical protein HOU03_gp147 [Caulobacter phage CcrSC]|uniref:Uncharacterized protein n=1 Tax=Caulobacter phage CcrSC TaxID=2283272 RepID=A0A385ECL6_9CAUD|nr:hypothetical protein HOU03_gp039 [Caulobacter phage CcrSC]YP_009810751.1 hypothetical protein HOU03_gp147 [Caulobacter phage CcrSC]AXQ69621.1 hypothetical protein CcrSC_gp039 [Caulobacter phage CcrSC]AXQ70121.1 hypothetical protein CcrSC_gp539 [Caulobacter phage CcrSC]
MTQEYTAEERQAKLTEMADHWREQLKDAQARLDMTVLVGQGFVCALERDLSMAIRADGPDRYRLWPVSARMVPILHFTKLDAMRVAAHWNGNLPDDKQDLRVVATHYRDVLQAYVETATAQIAWIEGGCKAA